MKNEMMVDISPSQMVATIVVKLIQDIFVLEVHQQERILVAGELMALHQIVLKMNEFKYEEMGNDIAVKHEMMIIQMTWMDEIHSVK